MQRNSSPCLREREMAFAAVISAMQTVERLMNSSRISLSPPSQRIIESAYEELKSLKETLKKLDGGSSKNCSWKAVNALDARIREAVSQFEDLLESDLFDQQSDCDFQFSIDLQHLARDVDLFVESTKKMEEEYDRELGNISLPEEEEEEEDFDGVKKRSKMVGLSDELSKMKDFLTNNSDAQHYVVSIVAFAMELFEDPLIARQLLVQVDPDTNLLLLEGDPDHKVQFNLYTHAGLGLPEVLLVIQPWEKSSHRYESPLKEVARHIYGSAYFNHRTIRISIIEQSGWRLLCRELRKPGKKIAENCFGLVVN